MLSDIMFRAQKTVIQELEMMAVPASARVWWSLVKTCRVVLFTDSEAIRGPFFKSWSANSDSDKMMENIFQVQEHFDVLLWIEHVPSQSNPADPVQRGCFKRRSGRKSRSGPLGNVVRAPWGNVAQWTFPKP